MIKKEMRSILLENSFRKQFIEKAKKHFGSQTALAKHLDLKIRLRHITQERIKDWKLGRHHFGWNVFMPIEVVKELCLINKVDFNTVLTKATKIRPSWTDPKNEKFLVKKKKPHISKRGSEKYLDLYTVLPKETLPWAKTRKGFPLFTKKEKEGIRLWSEASWRLTEIKLKRFVKIDELFFIGAALYASEGLTKIDNYNDCVRLGNTEPAIINLFLEWIDSFLKSYNLKFSIGYNGEDCNQRVIKNFWVQKVLYIKKADISQIKIRERANYGSALKNNLGIFSIRISNIVLKTFVIEFLEVAKALVFTEKEYALSYLRGLLAAEGSVNTRPVLKEVTIGCTYKNIKERNFIKSLLRTLGLKFCEGKNQISIINWDSFVILYKENVFKINQINSISKNKRFISGFIKHQKTQRLLKLSKFKKGKFTARDWQKLFGLKHCQSAYSFLERLVKDYFLLFHIKKNVKYYYINPQKVLFLESIWKLEDCHFNSLTI